MKIGTLIKQPQGYKAFIPEPFPGKKGFPLSSVLSEKASIATNAIGKLAGVTQLLPDIEFFIYMYVYKDATSSSQIEGTKATMVDAIEASSHTSENLPADVDDILHYIQALNYGLKRLEEFPFCLRFICEIHKELMDKARATHFCDPGNFRSSQNWIGGTSRANASFVPPPVHEMKKALDDLEKFIHDKDGILPVIKAGLLHAQFETIHPFLDGNGRTGRLLIILFLWLNKLIDRPTLFLSSYFKKYQKTYYEKLDGYHQNDVESWLEFFLDGIIETSGEGILTVKNIHYLRDHDMKKIQSLGKTAAESGVKILPQLFKSPIVNVNNIQQWTGFTRQGAQKIIDRFVNLDILKLKDENKTYGRSFIYRQYIDIFKE